MPERRCAVVGCETFPDAAWSLCAQHLAEIEAQIEEDHGSVMPERVMVFNVDASWSQYRGSRYNGELARGDASKFHIDRGDTTAKCSPRVILNSLPGDVGEWLDELEADTPSLVCRRCVPTVHVDGSTP